ncbi:MULTISPECIES: tyrosine-type recombinase/integrase [Halolamina]|uniref:Integrase/recombinase XerD n=1 Tax=Halolamina pelagica TaxID=699431 RepID=A0A1I5TCT6_9EURY|nr:MULTISPECIES: tyrosine-type recombinase/integrase [Halolamina]NHX37281.1 tyrosine-type recombinase/integrase [Halolamina sp. R1-12]SFP80830.1 integrase/recombinase XerD [Halolamina pelagica]
MTDATTTLDDFTNSEESPPSTTDKDTSGSETSTPESDFDTCPCWAEENDKDWQDLMDEADLYDPGCGHAIDYLRDNTNAKFKESTAKTYSSRLRYFIEHLHEHETLLQNATMKDVGRFMKKLARSGRSESTIEIYRTVITGVMKHIELYRHVEPEVRWEVVREEITPSSFQTPPEMEREPLDKEEAKRLFKELKTFRNRLLVQAGIELGPRSEDLRTIELDDIDIEGREIELKNTKSGGRYTLPLSEDLALRLRHWRSVERPSLPDAEDSKYLFPSEQGGALSGTQFNAIIKRAAERAGIQEVVGTMPLTERQQEILGIGPEKRFHRVTAHTLRHTFSNLLAEEGYELKDISLVLCHDSMETTQKYYFGNNSDIKEGMSSAFPSPDV